MNRLSKLLTVSLVLLIAGAIGMAPASASAAKELVVGAGFISDNTGDESARTVDIPITLKGGFNDVNGLAFTLAFDRSVFEFLGLVQGGKDLYNGDDYVPDQNEPSSDTLTNGLVYIANNPTGEGRVMIASAGANFLAQDTSDVVPFKARFRAILGAGQGTYPINAQQTIIGPETAADAGYTEPTPIPVAVGLAPDADPTTAASYAVQLVAGSIRVGGGYGINGTVVYEGGADADGATVRLRKKVDGAFVNNDETTVSSGAFSFTGKPNGEYQLEILSSKPGYQRRYTGPGFTVSGNEDRGQITLAAYSPISGRIQVNGGVVPGVKAKVALNGTVLGIYPVDANGNFVTQPLDPGKSYTVTAVYGSQESDPFTGDYDWNLGLGTLSGTLTGLQNGQSVMVDIESTSAGLRKALYKTGDGNPVAYQFQNLLPATDYVVSVVGDGIPVTYYDSVTDITQATLQTVVANQDTGGVDFTFAAPVQAVTGTVTEGGIGQSFVPVFAFDESTYAMQAVKTNENGVYTLNLGEGSYLVFALKSNRKTFYYKTENESTQVDAQAAPVTVVDADIDNINLYLDEENCAIQGRVSFKVEGGDPVEGVMVWAEGPNGSGLAVTDVDGEYAFSGLHCGDEYEVTIFPGSPYPPQTKTATAASDGDDLNFVIQTGWTFAGTVTDGITSDPIEDAWVYLNDSTGVLQGVPARTDNQGEFSLADIPTGIYTVYAEHGDYRPASDPNVSIQYDVTGYTISMSSGVTISGTVTESVDGDPIQGVHVSAVAVGQETRYATTDSNGEYTLAGLVDGTVYNLFFHKRGYLRKLLQTTAPDDSADVLLDKPVTLVDYSGTVKIQGGTGVPGARIVIYSASKNHHATRVTDSNGGFGFTGVVAASDYRLVVLPGRNQPGHVEDPVDLSNTVTNAIIEIPSGSIQGSVTLSDQAAGSLVTVYLLNSTTQKCVADVVAVHQGSGVYTYSFDNVKAATDYKVCAFSPGYGLGWYNGAADLGSATIVGSGDTGVNITLTSN